ncbi:MAG: hypothetical protein QGI46_15115 [Planctomycetota bacterium]|nr:hypothetical protein [Planctomycetota bacterium]
MNIALLALLALPGTSQDWHSTQLPSLSMEPVPAPAFAALANGQHVLLTEEPANSTAEPAPALPASQVRQMLEAEARRQGRSLSFYPTSPPLLVSGSPEDRAWIDTALDELQRAGERTEIEVSAWLRPGLAGGTTGDSLPHDGQAPAGSHAWHGRLRSGTQAAFGRRSQESFLAGFDVEVAQDEGVAVPVVGQVLAGHTLHVRAARMDGGRSIHIVGVLDLARLRTYEDFDPGTPDLGSVRQPLVDLVQVHFSGVVPSGGFLTVSIAGSPLDSPDWVLWVQAATQPDPERAPGAGWRVADLALLAAPASRLPTWRAHWGPRGWRLPSLAVATLPALAEPAVSVSPAGLDSLTNSADRRPPRSLPPAYWTERLLLVHPEDVERWQRTRELCRTMESARLPSARLELAAGDLRISLPIAAGVPARVLVGTERTFLVGYEAEVAPDVSMPAPVIERWFEGLAWQGRLSSGRLQATLRTTHTESVEIAPRSDTILGDLQLPRRSVRAAELSLALGAGAEVAFEAEADAAAVSLRLVEP